MNLVRLASILLSVFLIGYSLLVLIRSTKNAQNRLFSAALLASALWAVTFANIETPSNVSAVAFLNAVSYMLGATTMLFLALFTYYFPRKRAKKSFFVYLYFLVPTIFLSATPLIAGTVTKGSQGYEFGYGSLAVVYSVVLLGGVGLIVRNLVYFSRLQDLTTLEKRQARLVTKGFAFAFIFGVFFSTLLPVISPTTPFDDLAPFSVIAIAYYVGVAIFKHRLFDFRAVFARAAAYLLTTTILIIGYVSLAFFSKSILFPDLAFSLEQVVSNIALSVILVLLYPSLRRGFDKLTNRLFYRDAYDGQALIATLNKKLVGSLNVEKLLQDSAAIIQQNIKTDFCSVLLSDTKYVNMRMIGDKKANLSPDELRSVRNILENRSERLIYIESFEIKSIADKELDSIMRQNYIEIIVRLSGSEEGKKDIGYLLLGTKKSGNPYSKQDLAILQILSNELVIAVQNALRYEEIEQFSITLQKKVSDATRELRKSNEKLKALDEAKDEFISMASHQLRTPLTSVKGYLSMLAEGDAGEVNDVQKKFIDQAFISSQRMVYLIADLLNVSRLKTGKFVIESHPVYLPDVVESEIAQLYETVKSRGLTMTFNKPKQFATLNLDEVKLRQVIMNFTDNAIYYTPSGGEITISLSESPQSVEFTVTDNGLGVPKTDQQHLFTKFYRAGNARKARPDGTGLGLFMAKKVIVAQGGAIVFKSTEGKGSVFGFSFPKDKLIV